MKVNCSFTKMVDVVNLVENPKNANKHPQKQIELLAKIMEFQGWRHPIVVSKRSGFIVAGHGRLEAAKLNGWAQVPVDEQDFENEAAEYAFLISDNKIAELSEHDDAFMVDVIKSDFPDLDLTLLAMPDLKLHEIDLSETFEESQKQESEKKYLLEIQFPNDMEMMDIHDDLVSRGYVVKIR